MPRGSATGFSCSTSIRFSIPPPALELLIKTVGADRCLFGSECPGVGSAIDPDTGQTMDNIRPHIEKFEWLSPPDRDKIFSGNARKVFNLKI